VLFQSTFLAKASGSLAGSVFSHNKGGMYMRSRSMPTNPNTLPQQAVRDAMRICVNAWTNVLTNTERDSWNLYAFNTPILNKIGLPTKRSGQNMFIRSNVSRLQAILPQVNTGPSTFDLGSFTPIDTPTADASSQLCGFNFTNADDWANDLAGAMLVYQSRPQNPTIDFFKGPWQLATIIAGSSMTPPTSPASWTSLFPLVAGQKLFIKVRVTQPDGRLSDPQTIDKIVVP